MNSVVFETAAGEPFAELVMSMPIERQRVGMFFRKPAEADGAEVRALRPGVPNQYACDFRASRDGTSVSFTNDEGWRIDITLDASDVGHWSASNGHGTLRGRAHGVHFPEQAKTGLAARVSGAIRGLFT